MLRTLLLILVTAGCEKLINISSLTHDKLQKVFFFRKRGNTDTFFIGPYNSTHSLLPPSEEKSAVWGVLNAETTTT